MGPKGESRQDRKHKFVAPVNFILPQMGHQQGTKHNMRIFQALLLFLAHISNHCFHYRLCWHPQILSIYMASCEPIFRVKNSQCLWPQPTLDPLLQSRPIAKDLWFGRSIVQGSFPTVPQYVSIYLNIPPTHMPLVCVPATSIMCTIISPFICASFSHSVILDIGVIK